MFFPKKLCWVECDSKKSSCLITKARHFNGGKFFRLPFRAIASKALFTFYPIANSFLGDCTAFYTTDITSSVFFLLSLKIKAQWKMGAMIWPLRWCDIFSPSFIWIAAKPPILSRCWLAMKTPNSKKCCCFFSQISCKPSVVKTSGSTKKYNGCAWFWLLFGSNAWWCMLGMLKNWAQRRAKKKKSP